MVTIGNNVLFGPYVFITDGYHKYNEIGKTIEEQGDGEKQRIFIDDDVWVGAKTSIMRGVHIYEGTIIGTGSIVTKNMPPYCVCAGFPCKPIKLRYTDDELRIHYLKRNQNIDNAEKLISLRREILNQLKSNLLKNEEV
jgi:maltose O-acetyltransferase